MDETLNVFINEARGQLCEMERGLLALEAGERDAETVNAVFRAAHTIKGGAGVVDLGPVERFTHVVENVLDRLRNGDMAVSAELVSTLLRCCDHIGALLDVVVRGAPAPESELESAGDALHATLNAMLGAPAAPQPAQTAQPSEPIESGRQATNDCWHLSVRFGRSVLKSGVDPAAVLHFLSTLGEIVHLTTLADAMPCAADMDPEACYLGFEIDFRSTADKAEIERIFDFVRDDCELHILPPYSRVADYVRLIEELPEQTMRIGEILVKSGALTQEELDEGLDEQMSGGAVPEGAAPARIGEILIDGQRVQPPIVEAAAAKQRQVNARKADEARLIRIHADKLDQLIDLVGELVIAGASANLVARKSRQTELVEATSVLTRLVENIRDSALQLRMVQIGETFSRFHRVVRDGALELGKTIELVITGADTELDKSVVEKIGDPLMHLVRNAMDHGLETATERSTAGKPAAGRIELNAFHDSGSIVIEVADDGRGLPREKIRAKAIDKGLIAPTQALTDAEIANLIFQPGFSTAEQVTNLSGRGVGMDVVRRNIEGLRGTVDVRSEEGRGSRFTIRLPLTLAIIEGFLIGVEKSSFVIPLEAVVECLELPALPEGRNYVNLRGAVLPVVRLREMFEVATPRPARENVVVVKYGDQMAGIVVDVLHGEFQTVIKPLGALFRHLRGISGSTILGSGEVALILDVQTLAALAASAEHSRLASADARH